MPISLPASRDRRSRLTYPESRSRRARSDRISQPSAPISQSSRFWPSERSLSALDDHRPYFLVGPRSRERINPCLPQRVLHKASLCLRIGLAFISIRLGETVFQLFVPFTQVGLRSQQIAKHEQLAHMRVVVLDEVEVVCSSVRPRTQEPESPGTIRI